MISISPITVPVTDTGDRWADRHPSAAESLMVKVVVDRMARRHQTSPNNNIGSPTPGATWSTTARRSRPRPAA